MYNRPNTVAFIRINDWEWLVCTWRTRRRNDQLIKKKYSQKNKQN